MNELHNLIAQLEDEYTFDNIVIDPPNAASTTGAWWVELYLDGKCIDVEWRPQEGFGVSLTILASSEDMFERHDQTFPTLHATYTYIRDLLTSHDPSVKEAKIGT